MAISPSARPSIYPFIHLSVYLSIHLSIYHCHSLSRPLSVSLLRWQSIARSLPTCLLISPSLAISYHMMYIYYPTLQLQLVHLRAACLRHTIVRSLSLTLDVEWRHSLIHSSRSLAHHTPLLSLSLSLSLEDALSTATSIGYRFLGYWCIAASSGGCGAKRAEPRCCSTSTRAWLAPPRGNDELAATARSIGAHTGAPRSRGRYRSRMGASQ